MPLGTARAEALEEGSGSISRVASRAERGPGWDAVTAPRPPLRRRLGLPAPRLRHSKREHEEEEEQGIGGGKYCIRGGMYYNIVEPVVLSSAKTLKASWRSLIWSGSYRHSK